MPDVGYIVIIIGGIIAAVLGWGKLQRRRGRKEKESEIGIAGVTELAKRDRKESNRATQLAKKVDVIEDETEKKIHVIKTTIPEATPDEADALKSRADMSVEALIADTLNKKDPE